MRFVSRVTPVALPPGRLKLATRPSATGSPPIPNTIGIVDVGRERGRLSASGREHGHSPGYQFRRHGRQEIVAAARPAELDGKILTLNVSTLGQTSGERGDEVCGILGRARA